MDQRNHPRPIRPLEKKPDKDPQRTPEQSFGSGNCGEENGRPRRQQKRKRLACKGCRQAKIRCDVSNPNAGPCARCRRMKLECVIDAGFKRVTKRRKIQDFGEPEQQLLSPVDTNYVASNTSVTEQNSSYLGNIENVGSSHYSETPAVDIPSISFVPPINEQSFGEYPTVPGSLSNFSGAGTSPQSLRHDGSRKLGNLTVNNSDIHELFKIFFDNYHPHLNLLDPSLSPDEYYARSPLLFWVIISVASRQYKPEPTLVTSLVSPVMKLLWNNLSKLPPNPSLIQAILLICAWPFPTTTMWENPSYILIHVAKAAITHLGLHRPETVTDFSRVKRKMNTAEIQEAIKMWAACYVIGQGIIVSVGQQPLLTVDWAIDRACEPNNVYALPDDSRHQILITQFSCHISQVMSENRRSPTGLPVENEIGTLLAILEREFEDLNRRLGGKLTAINQVQLTCTHLQLLTFHFFCPTPTRQRGLLRSYHTAYSLITQASDLSTYPLNFILYTPSYFGQILTLAGVILLKILHSSFVAYVDFAAGKRAFNTVVSLLRNSSIEDNDLSGRGSKILSQLWAVHASLGSKGGQGGEPGVRLKSRSSASIMHDALWAWRERFAKQGSRAPSPGSGDPESRDEENNEGATGNVNEGATGLDNTDTTLLTHNIQSRDMREIDMDQQLDLMEQAFATMPVELEDMGSIWDISIPSLLPIDLDAYNFS